MRLALTLLLALGLAACSAAPDLSSLPSLPGGGGLPGSGSSPAPDPGSGNSDTDAPGEGVWANYDFIPGERVLFAHDFEGSRVGDFPSRLGFIAGNLDVVRLGENQVLRVGEGTSEGGGGGNGCFTIELPETLPEQATIEFRVRTSDPLHRARVQLFSDASDDTPDPRCTYPPNPNIFVESNSRGLKIDGSRTAGVDRVIPTNEWLDVRLSADGDYWKMYVNEERVSNAPGFPFPRANKLHVFLSVYRYSLYLDDIRIAEGGPNNVPDAFGDDDLIETTAIRFDFGSDRLRPESTGILDEMAALIRGTSGTVQIEGHTDSDGTETFNQDLSERRAEAVQRYLVGAGIPASRLTAVGFGESRPAASNETPEGRAQNRRVGFRRMN